MDVRVVPDHVWEGLDDEQRMLLLAELQRIAAAPFAASAGRIGSMSTAASSRARSPSAGGSTECRSP